MKCSNCQSENSDTAKFCKKCGNPLDQNSINHGEMIKSMSGEKSGDDNTTKIMIIALVIVAVVLAGAFVYLFAFGDSGTTDSASNSAPASQDANKVNDSDTKVATKTSSSAPKTPTISIKGGSFSTGSADSDKTYARIFVGKENAGTDVIVQIWYSRDGNTLNHGNMVPATVHSDGYLEISSADAYKYYPDHATINIYDGNSNLLDTQSVSLSPTSGTQTF